MKKIIFLFTLSLGLFLGGTAVSHAQSDTTGTTTLNVILHPAISIKVNDPTVTLNMITPNDYANGKDTTLLGHLTVVSTGGFSVKVKADGPLTSGSNTIPISDIQVSGAASSTNPATNGMALPSGTFTNNLALSTSNQTLFSTTTSGTSGSDIDVKYRAVGGPNFTNALQSISVPQTDQTFTATITYTITAP